MDERERRDIGELFDHFADGLGTGISEELGEIKEALEDEILTMPSKDPEHIFADAEVVGKFAEREHLKGAITGFGSERKRFQAKAEKSKEETVLLRKIYDEALRDLVDDYDQLNMRHKGVTKLLAINEEGRSQEQVESEEVEQLKKQIKRQWNLIENLKTAIAAVQTERNQFRKCVNAIRIELGSVPKNSIKGKLEEFVSCAKEAISRISV